MTRGTLRLDHLVAAVADPAASGDQLKRLGFTVTPLSVIQTMGVANRLVLLTPETEGAANFIEVMGIVEPQRVPPPLRVLLEGSSGFRWMVLSTPSARDAYESLSAAGYPFRPPIAVERDWVLPGGEVLRVAFDVTLPIDAPLPFNFCGYKTLEHYKRPPLLHHRNGARTLTAFICQSERPAELAKYYESLFQVAAQRRPDGLISIGPAHVRLLIGSAQDWSRIWRLDHALASGAADRFLGCRIRVQALDQTRCALESARAQILGRADELVVRAPFAADTYLVFHA